MSIDFTQRMRSADPAADLATLPEERAAALLHRIVTLNGSNQAPSTSAGDAATHRRSTRRLALGVAGLVTATAVTSGVVVLGPTLAPGPDGTTFGASAVAAELLGKAADITPLDPPAKPSQYWRITTTGTALSTTVGRVPGRGSASYLVSSTRTAYVAVDGTRPTWFVEGPAKGVRQLSGAPGAGAPGGDGTTYVWTTNLSPAKTPGSWQHPNLVWLRGLPRDPAQLRARLYADAAGHGQSTDGEVLVLVADALRSGLVPGDLRAAMFKVLATVPGVEVTAASAAVNGRTGVAIGRNETAGVDRQELVIHPTTGQVVGERSVAIRDFDGIAAGTVIGDTAVTRTLVDAVPPEVAAQAVRHACTVQPDGGTACKELTGR